MEYFANLSDFGGAGIGNLSDKISFKREKSGI